MSNTREPRRASSGPISADSVSGTARKTASVSFTSRSTSSFSTGASQIFRSAGRRFASEVADPIAGPQVDVRVPGQPAEKLHPGIARCPDDTYPYRRISIHPNL